MKDAILETQDEASLARRGSERKESIGPILKEKHPSLVSRISRSSRGGKEAIKIAGRCASCLGNFQRIAFNMIGI